MVKDNVRFIEHKGKNVLLISFAGVDFEELVQVVKAAREIIQSAHHNSILALTDATDAHLSPAMAKALKEFTTENGPYIKASAVFGMSRLSRALYEAVIRFSRRKIVTFASKEEALDYLVNQ